MNGDLIVHKWRARFMGREMPVAIGRGGIGKKQGEGDGVTPIGTYEIDEWLVRGDRLPLGFRHIHPRGIWCDDAADEHYTRETRAPFQASHEKLFRPDPLYDLIGIVNYNRNPIIGGAGSAIFVHQWRKSRFPTEGCVAFSRADLIFIATHWQKNSRLVIQG